MAKKDLFGTICPGIVPESERSISYFFSAKRLVKQIGRKGQCPCAACDVVLCSTALGSPLTSENPAARIAQLNIMDAIFMAVAQKSYSSAEENLARTMSAVMTKRRE
jgi:hypothetical protein